MWYCTCIVYTEVILWIRKYLCIKQKVWLLNYRNIKRQCIDSLGLSLGFSITHNIDVTFRSSVFNFPYHARYRFCDTSQSRTEYHYHMVNSRDNHVSTSSPRLNDTFRFSVVTIRYIVFIRKFLAWAGWQYICKFNKKLSQNYTYKVYHTWKYREYTQKKNLLSDCDT